MNEWLTACKRESAIPLGVKRLPFDRSAEFVSELESLASLARLPSVVGGTHGGFQSASVLPGTPLAFGFFSPPSVCVILWSEMHAQWKLLSNLCAVIW